MTEYGKPVKRRRKTSVGRVVRREGREGRERREGRDKVLNPLPAISGGTRELSRNEGREDREERGRVEENGRGDSERGI